MINVEDFELQLQLQYVPKFVYITQTYGKLDSCNDSYWSEIVFFVSYYVEEQ